MSNKLLHILAVTSLLLFFQYRIPAAQNLITIDYAAFAQSNPAKDPANPALENLEIDISRLDFAVKYSFQLYSDKTIISNRINFSRLYFEFINWNDSYRNYRPDKMYGLSYEFSIKQMLSTKNYLSLRALPGIYSEFHSLKDDDFRMQGAIILGNDSGPALDCGLGIAYLDILGESDLWPAIYLYWHLNETNSILLDFPHLVEYNYNFLDGLEFGVMAELRGNRYHIDDQAVISSYENNSVQYSMGTAGIYSKIRVTGNLFGMFQLGYTFRKFLEINDTPWREHGEFNTNHNFFIRLSLELRTAEALSY
jgi:hypothetical protein